MSFFRPEIEAMAGYVPGEQPQEDGITKLNTNENPYPPSPAVAAAIQEDRWPAEKISRSHGRDVSPPGGRSAGRRSQLDPLRQRQRRHFDHYHSHSGRSGRVAPPALSQLYTLQNLGRTSGRRYEEIHFQADWSLPERFALPEGNPRLVFLANPNSPSGTVVAPERVLEIGRSLPCPLFVDEAYVDFAETNCLDLVAKCEKIMVSRSLSKSYSLAGLRFGYLVAQPHLIEQFIKLKDSYNCDALSIAAATAAIGDGAWLAENRSKIIATRNRLLREMRTLGFITVDSQANFTWNTLPGRSVRSFYEELKRRGILVRYMDYPGWGDGLRVSVGTDAETDTLLDQLKTMV